MPGVNPENGGWVRPLPKCTLLGEETSPATLLAVGITSFYRDRAGEHPWSASVSEGFTPGLGGVVSTPPAAGMLSEGFVSAMCRKHTGLLLTSKLLSKAVVKTSSSHSSLGQDHP